MKAQIVSFNCTLRNQVGKLISTTFNQDVIASDTGPEGTLPGLARGMTDLKKGEHRQICLSAQEAYGFYRPDLLIEVSRKSVDPRRKLKIGDQVWSESAHGKPESYRVVELSADFVMLDGNHPLAGQDLIFDIEAVEARDATAEEIAESLPADSSRLNYH